MRESAETLRRDAHTGSPASAATASTEQGEVTVAPSPADTGLTLTFGGLGGSTFPDPATEGAFDVLAFSSTAIPTADVTEILHVTDSTGTSSGDWTFERQQYGSPALSIAVGWDLWWSPDAMALDLRAWLETALAAQAFGSEPAVTIAPVDGNFASGAANRGYLTMVIVEREQSIGSVQFRVANSSGNIDVGIYNADRDRLWSRGSVACPAIGAASIDISAGSPTSLTLGPGVYYFALAASGTVATFRGTQSQLEGMSLLGNTKFPLPDPFGANSANTTEIAPYGAIG